MGSIVIKNGVFPPLTDEQKKEIEAAKHCPINYDDIPPLSDEQLARMVRVNRQKPQTA